MDIKRLYFIILILNICLTIDNTKGDGDISNQEIKITKALNKKQLRFLENSWFTDILIMLTVWGAYLCFLIVGLWLLFVFCIDEKEKEKYNFEDINVCNKLKAIYLFKSS